MKDKCKKNNVESTSDRPKHPNLFNFNQKGITVIALIITIVVMLILVAVTINIGMDNIEYSKLITFVSYMQTIQKKVDQIVENGNYNEYGSTLTNEQETKLKEILEIDDVSNFKYFDNTAIKEQFEIENIEDEIAINFKTREVISLLGFEYEGEIHYSQYNLPGGQKLVSFEETQRTVTIGEIIFTVDGLNGTITINGISITNGTLYYGKEYEKTTNEGITKYIDWKIATNKTVQDESITTPNITESGKYYIKLVDNTTGKDNSDSEGKYPSIIIRLTNTPKLKEGLSNLSTKYNYSDLSASENWAYATDETSAYVWIPRFAYETGNTSNIEFIRGNSNVTSSGGYIDGNWTIPPQFTEGTTEFTGVWVEVDKVNKEGIDIIDILKTGTIL